MMTAEKTDFEQSWHRHFVQVCLDSEIYPNDEIAHKFLIVSKRELRELNKNTDKRIKLYNKTRPNGWVTYE